MTTFDHTRAEEEGWCIMTGDSSGDVRIERDLSREIFKTEDEAIGYVVTKALEGSHYHREALRHIGFHFSAEEDRSLLAGSLEWLNAAVADEPDDWEGDRRLHHFIELVEARVNGNTPYFPQVHRIPDVPCYRCGREVPFSGKEAVFVMLPPAADGMPRREGHWFCGTACSHQGPRKPLLVIDLDGTFLKYPAQDTPMHHDLSPEAVAALQRVVAAIPDLECVVSSSRRRTPSLEKLRKPWEEAGLPPQFLHWSTPDLTGKVTDVTNQRAEEIKLFLKHSGKRWRWAVLDDQVLGMKGVIPPERLLTVNPAEGLTEWGAQQLIAMLTDDRDHPWPVPLNIDDQL